MRRFLLAGGLIVWSVAATPLAVSGQEPCRVPAPPPSRQPNIFSQGQETTLGEVLAERMDPYLNVIDDDALAAELRRIGERVAAHLPAGELRPRFHLIDVPEVNAIVLPGGFIYVTRRLIGFARSEDEVAGVIGHELGHLVARQLTIEATRQMREVLRVTALGDAADVVARYNQLMDNRARKPRVFDNSSHENDDQIEADRLGLQLVAAAGYDTAAFAAFYDRLAETGGRTGSVLSRMFGATSPESRRLREILQSVQSAPTACAAPRAAADGRSFPAWQAAVMGYRGTAGTEQLPGLVSRTTMADPLRGELLDLRFSPDGRVLLAQDAAGVTVLTRDPFAVRFRIPAPDVEQAVFSPDSRHVLWHSLDLHVERWSVETGQPVSRHDLVVREGCVQTAMASNGATVACVETDGDLHLIDVATGARIHEAKAFRVVDAFLLFLNAEYGFSFDTSLGTATLRFSPDGRFFIGSYRYPIVYDLQTRAEVTLRPEARRLVASAFAFIGPDRVIGRDATDRTRSGVVRLPDGVVSDRLELSPGRFERPSAGDYLLVRPFQKFAVGLLDLQSKTFIKAHPMPAFDIHGDVFVAERGTGDVGLYASKDNSLVAAATLPTAPIGRVYATAVSPDLRWLAVSERARGAIWDLSRNARLGQVRGFGGAHAEPSGEIFVDFARTTAEPRAVMKLDAVRNDIATIANVTEPYATQRGPWLLVTKTLPEGDPRPTGAAFELRDVRQARPIWTRTFQKDPPRVWLSPAGEAVILAWPAEAPPARDRIRNDERLRAAVKAHEMQDDHLLEVLDARTGDVRGRLFVETGKGSFGLAGVQVMGDRVIVSDTIDRVLVYSLATGDVQGYAFGRNPVVDGKGARVAVQTGAGRLSLHDLDTMTRTASLRFGQPIVFNAFDESGARLFVLTADHTTFVIDATQAGRRRPGSFTAPAR